MPTPICNTVVTGQPASGAGSSEAWGAHVSDLFEDRVASGVSDLALDHVVHTSARRVDGSYAIPGAARLVAMRRSGTSRRCGCLADRVILEVNSWQPIEMEGMHDIYYGTALPPHRTPIEIPHPADRIGVPHLRCDPEKVVAVVETNAPDRNSPFNPPDPASQQIAGHVLEFLGHEVRHGRLPPT
jgi:hypothetical protein